MKVSQTRIVQFLCHKDPLPTILKGGLALSVLTIAGYFLFEILGVSLLQGSAICSSERVVITCDAFFFSSTLDHFFRLAFLVLFMFFLRLWWVYFNSAFRPQELRNNTISPDFSSPYAVQSLRRFLRLCSQHWVSQRDIDKQQTDPLQVTEGQASSEDITFLDLSTGSSLSESFRRKAGSSVEVSALLMVVITLILDKSTDVFISALNGDITLTFWPGLMLFLSVISGIFAFIGFLISVDALDTTFNKFISNDIRDVSLQYFYQITSTPRYLANAAMMMSLVFFLAHFSFMLASLSLILLIYTGYFLWFPDFAAKIREIGYPLEYVDDPIAENSQNTSSTIYARRRNMPTPGVLITSVVALFLYFLISGLVYA